MIYAVCRFLLVNVIIAFHLQRKITIDVRKQNTQCFTKCGTVAGEAGNIKNAYVPVYCGVASCLRVGIFFPIESFHEFVNISLLC